MRFELGLILFFMCACIACSPVSGYNFTLSVYGNANMDDIIDGSDLTYLQGIIDGTKEKTKFADVNNDGSINEADVTLLQAILDGDAKQMTIVDNKNVTVTVDTPITQVVDTFLGSIRPVVQLDAINSLVGVCTISNQSKDVMMETHPEIYKIPTVGTSLEPSQEAILSLKPDVMYGGFFTTKEIAQGLVQNTKIPFIYAAPLEVASFDHDDGAYETWRLVGLLQGSDPQKRAEELIKFSDDKIKSIEKVTSTIPDKDKPRVYLACYASPTQTVTFYQPIDIAGGINVAKDLPAGSAGWGGVDVSKEQIVKWNPDIILVHAGTKEDDGIHGSIEGILSDPALQSVNAVKNKQVYGTKGWATGWDPATGLCECLYLAKIFLPDEFKNLDVDSECNDILKEFYGVPGLYDWMVKNCGTYVTWK
jgi:iron complex transport system substrate-binding protein